MPFRVAKGGGVFAIASPWRQHHNRRGHPKVVYATKDAADEAASEQTAKAGHDISAYICTKCEEYHTGGTRRYLNFWQREFLDLERELGIRVAANIKRETLHPFKAIKQRGKTAMMLRIRFYGKP